jgi:hypothetical protein
MVDELIKAPRRTLGLLSSQGSRFASHSTETANTLDESGAGSGWHTTCCRVIRSTHKHYVFDTFLEFR